MSSKNSPWAQVGHVRAAVPLGTIQWYIIVVYISCSCSRTTLVLTEQGWASSFRSIYCSVSLRRRRGWYIFIYYNIFIKIRSFTYIITPDQQQSGILNKCYIVNFIVVDWKIAIYTTTAPVHSMWQTTTFRDSAHHRCSFECLAVNKDWTPRERDLL